MNRATAPLLLVDDNDALRLTCCEALTAAGWDVTAVATGQDALAELQRADYPLACVDLVLPDMGGLAVLSAIHERNPRAKVILMTGFASLDSAVEAVRRGAYDYLRKPFSATDLLAIVDAAHAAHLSETRQAASLQARAPETSQLDALVSLARELQHIDAPMQTLRRIIGTGIELTEADSGAVLAFGQDKAVLEVLCAAGSLRGELEALPVTPVTGLLAEAMDADGPICVPDFSKRPLLAADPLNALDIYCALACPIIVDGKAEGVLLLLDKYAAPFSKQDEALITVLAMHAAAPAAALRHAECTSAGADATLAGEFIAFTQFLEPR